MPPSGRWNGMANGVLIIDKPQEWTSMDVCAKLRGVLREKRIGLKIGIVFLTRIF